ncbi:Platelet-activating factor acetylhydrolase, plasma/intracellular isoform II [Dictyocaulus viviparus]|uniref:1-alkyl-2-acetylglycerophosphocholine esterase n=1 Tax=Dictyocaulus viviparus TaxID=29172 RepID=A0A0D8XMM6_DICVI|nr:Platelet-activating factor acetylhydrolase, plasma/intracellular isoform II [Dictyocaulus viviparus]
MGALWSYINRYSILPLCGSGNYKAGCTDLMITDSNDGDTGVFMRLYYPVDKGGEADTEAVSDHPLWIDRAEYVDGLASYMKQTPGRLHFFLNWIVGEIRMACVWNRKLADHRHVLSSHQRIKESFPLVIFSHGLSGCRHFYSTYCSSLASYGFVVAAVEHRCATSFVPLFSSNIILTYCLFSDYSACWTYKLIPDSVSGCFKERCFPIHLIDHNDKRMFKTRNQQLNKRVSECVKALHVLEEINLGQLQNDKIAIGNDFDWSLFRGRLDLSRAFIAGHSFGGATSIAATAFSTDFQAAVVLDGWLLPLDSGHYERASQPTLFLNAGNWQTMENIERMNKCRNITEKLFYTLRDAEHQTFTDFAFLVNPFIGRRMKLHGGTPPTSTMEAIVNMTVSYLNRDQNVKNGIELVHQKYREFVINGIPSTLMTKNVQ